MASRPDVVPLIARAVAATPLATALAWLVLFYSGIETPLGCCVRQARCRFDQFPETDILRNNSLLHESCKSFWRSPAASDPRTR